MNIPAKYRSAGMFLLHQQSEKSTIRREGSMPANLKITTELLLKGMLLFTLIDLIYLPLLVRWVRAEVFKQMKWPLALAAAIVWCGIWLWALGNFWETVYRYVFPLWAQTWVPLIAGGVAALVALGLWTLAIRLKGNPTLLFCLLGGSLGILTHIWAVYRGIVTKPPMLIGASPVAAVSFAGVEYLLYWCVITTLAALATLLIRGMRRN
jgi:hypothetical protein